MPSWKLVAAWVVVVVATTLLAWQIVSLADSQVSATPAEIITATTSQPSVSTSSTTTTRATSSSAPVTVTTGSAPSTSSTTATGPAPAEWSVRTVTSQGGTVIVRHRPGEVELQAATPLPGFVMEIEDAGPDRVRVEFENELLGVRVEIRPSGEGLSIEID